MYDLRVFTGRYLSAKAGYFTRSLENIFISCTEENPLNFKP